MGKVKAGSIFILLLIVSFITIVNAFWASSVLVNEDIETTNINVGPFELAHNELAFKIDGGRYHSVAIDNEGRLWSWGYNNNGQLGNGSQGTNGLIPKLIPNMEAYRFSSVSAGYHQNIAIDSDGYLWSWGYRGSYGLLGNGTTSDNRTLTPKPIPLTDDMKNVKFSAISAGENHNLAIDESGYLWAWGRNDHGELGTNDFDQKSVPTPISTASNTKFKYIATGQYSSYAIDIYGYLWSWGYHGEKDSYLASESPINLNVPTLVENMTDTTFEKVAAGKYIFVAIDSQKRLWSWGYNLYGGLGNERQDYTTKPLIIPSVQNQQFVDISIDSLSDHVIARSIDNKLWIWGDNRSAQLGNGSNINLSSPYFYHIPQVNDFLKDKEIILISAGSLHSIALDSSGQLWSWGYNNNGQLGIGSTELTRLPTAIYLIEN